MNKTVASFLITLFIIFCVQACSNVPLSTMMKMSGFDEDDFIKLTPEDIRVRVRSNTKVNVLAANQLSYSYKGSEAYIEECLTLVKLEEENIKTIEHWFREDSFEHISWYQLDKEGIEQFRSLQRHPILKNTDREGSFELSIQTVYTEDSPNQFELSVDLLLNPEDGYFTMFEGLEIDQSPARSDVETCEAE